MVFSVILLVLTFVAVMLVSGNNLSACVGPIIGSRIIGKRFGVFLGASGFSAGILLQGSTMTKTVGVLLPSSFGGVENSSFVGGYLNFCCRRHSSSAYVFEHVTCRVACRVIYCQQYFCQWLFCFGGCFDVGCCSINRFGVSFFSCPFSKQELAK